MNQRQWRECMERKFHPGAPNPTGGISMAHTVKLPARSNAVTYDPTEVADVLLALLNSSSGEGVVVDEDTDTEPKARVRARTMAKLLGEGVTVEVDALDDIEEVTDENRDDIIDEYGDEGGESVTLPGIKVRTHVVPNGDAFVPVVSRRKES